MADETEQRHGASTDHQNADHQHEHGHDHDHGHDHGHEHGAPVVPRDRIELLSVGVDIGSATSHLMFSQLVLEKFGNRYETVERNAIFESEIMLTPYEEGFTIDQDLLGQFINEQYQNAGVERDLVDTGALILTGVALMRTNSRIIGELFSSEAGRFVSVSAGDNMENVLAARGSGATTLSTREGLRLLHIDIGGGTTKISICNGGRVLSTLAIDVGARIIVRDDNDRIIRLEESAKKAAQILGIELSLGEVISTSDLSRIVDYLVAQVLLGTPLSMNPGEPTLLRGPALTSVEAIDAVTFSGGVAEYIYDREDREFGDLGPLIAKALRDQLEELSVTIRELDAGIRATVLGASQYTTQVSGSTIYLSDPNVVPLRNVQVVPPPFELENEIDSGQIAAALKSSLTQYDLEDYAGPLGISFGWEGQSAFSRIGAFASGIMAGLSSWNNGHDPIVLLCNNDIGRLLGRHLVQELGFDRPLVCIDCIDLTDFGFVDVGSLVAETGAVPVVIKSLVFPD